MTLQKTLAISILFTGIIGVILAFSSDQTYRQLAYKQQQEFANQLITIKTGNLIRQLLRQQQEAGFRLKNKTQLTEALKEKNSNEIIYWLDQEFNNNKVTKLAKLVKIIIFDSDLHQVTYSRRGIKISDTDKPPCSKKADQLTLFSGIQQTIPVSQICISGNRTLLSTIIFIDNLKPGTYINIISDPEDVLTEIESALGMPVQIYSQNRVLLHKSPNWPDSKTIHNHLLSSYEIYNDTNDVLLFLSTASDIAALKTRLKNTRFKSVLSASALTALSLIITIIILRHGLSPLKTLSKAVNSCARGKFTIAEETIQNEIRPSIKSLNLMAGNIQSYIGHLKNKISDHQAAAEKQKHTIARAELHIKQIRHQNNYLQMTMQSIVSGVITTDIDSHIKTINPVAQQLTGWTAAEAKNKLLSQVMHVISADTYEHIHKPVEKIKDKRVPDKSISALLVQNYSNAKIPVEYVIAPLRDHEDKFAGLVVTIHDESVQRSLNRQLTFLATHDALTGLINHYEFQRRLKNIISALQKKQQANCLCYIEIDQFKLINDTCGHTAGDELLKQTAMILQANLDSCGLLARLDGARFGLLLKSCDIPESLKLTRLLRDAIQQFQFIWKNSQHVISISIAISTITQTFSSEEILRKADSACQLTRENGNNRIQIITDTNNIVLTQQREIHWASRINHALEEGRLQLYFQQIKQLDGCAGPLVLHGEILLRMTDKEGNIVTPGDFLPAAEHYSIITQIDEWVVDKSLQWLALHKSKITISVNLSGKSLSNKEFLNFIVRKIKQYRIKPQRLCFEITETAAISHVSRAIYFIRVLKKLGCSFALDDFGSGFSSFSYLTSLPVDYLKIDGIFVKDIDQDPVHYAMVKSINEMGKLMGMHTIAEYATSEDIIRRLRKAGIDYAQGYAIARPVPLTSVTEEYSNPGLSSV